MDLTLLHPKIVHLPIALAVLLPLLASGLLFAEWVGWLPRRAWWIAVALQVVLLGSGFAAMQTGEIDEEPVERVVPHAAVEAHEDAAKGMMAGAAAALLLMLAGGFVASDQASRVVKGVSVVATVAVLGLGYRVGEAGGALVYEHGAAQAFAPAGGSSAGASPVVPAHRSGDDDRDRDDD